MYLKQSDIFNFNVDEIEIYGVFSNYEILLQGVNDSNSDYIVFDDFTIKKSDNLRDYRFKIDFWKNNFPCFAFYIGKPLNARITTRDYFKVYGSAFRIMELNEIIDFIDTYVQLDYIDRNKGKRTHTLKRFDLAVDIKKDISKDIIKNFSPLTQKGVQYHGEKGKLESYYIGEYKKRLNKSFLIRIYDKIKDIKTKNKQSIFEEYLLETSITRIEIEFRTEVTKTLDLHQLLDRSYIFNLFIKYLEKHTKLFDKIKTQDVEKLKRLNKKVKLEDLMHDQVLKDRYLKAYLGYGKNILKIGLCPVDYLIKCRIISERTLEKICLAIKDNKLNLSLYDKNKYRKESKKYE